MKCLAEFPRQAGGIWPGKLLKGFILTLSTTDWQQIKVAVFVKGFAMFSSNKEAGREKERENLNDRAKQCQLEKGKEPLERQDRLLWVLDNRSLILLMKILVQIIKLLIDAHFWLLTFLILRIMLIPTSPFVEGFNKSPMWGFQYWYNQQMKLLKLGNSLIGLHNRMTLAWKREFYIGLRPLLLPFYFTGKLCELTIDWALESVYLGFWTEHPLFFWHTFLM